VGERATLQKVLPGKSHLRVRISTIDLLVPTSLDQLLLKMKILFMCFTKQTILMRRSIVLSLPLQLVFPGLTYLAGDPQTT
jgi:hypothetical protein